jgi:hypothetical protein
MQIVDNTGTVTERTEIRRIKINYFTPAHQPSPLMVKELVRTSNDGQAFLVVL